MLCKLGNFLAAPQITDIKPLPYQYHSCSTSVVSIAIAVCFVMCKFSIIFAAHQLTIILLWHQSSHPRVITCWQCRSYSALPKQPLCDCADLVGSLQWNSNSFTSWQSCPDHLDLQASLQDNTRLIILFYYCNAAVSLQLISCHNWFSGTFHPGQT